MKNLSPKHRKILMWTMVAVCAVIYAAVDLQDPVQIHPEVKGWKTLKIGMPISEARNELRKYCKDLSFDLPAQFTNFSIRVFQLVPHALNSPFCRANGFKLILLCCEGTSMFVALQRHLRSNLGVFKIQMVDLFFETTYHSA